jgi:hypothetical protein
MSQISHIHFNTKRKVIHIGKSKTVGQGLIKNSFNRGIKEVRGLGLVTDAKNGVNNVIKRVRGMGINPVVGDFAIKGPKMQDNAVRIGGSLSNEMNNINFNKAKTSLKDLKKSAIKFIV